MKGIVMMLRSMGVDIDPAAVSAMWAHVQVALPTFLRRSETFLTETDARLVRMEASMVRMEADIAFLKQWAADVSKLLEGMQASCQTKKRAS